MKEKLTPQEKKRLSYKKDYRTHTGEPERGMRKTWAERKARVNRKYRRKADATLHKALSPERIDAVKEGDDETTQGLIRKDLTGEKNPPKWRVSSLKETLKRRAESKKSSVGRKAKHLAALIQKFKADVTAFEKNPEALGEDEVGLLIFQWRSSDLRPFLKDNPSWIRRLGRKVGEVRKERRKEAEKARLKAEAKWKWRSPVLRLPRNMKSEEKNGQ